MTGPQLSLCCSLEGDHGADSQLKPNIYYIHLFNKQCWILIYLPRNIKNKIIVFSEVIILDYEKFLNAFLRTFHKYLIPKQKIDIFNQSHLFMEYLCWFWKLFIHSYHFLSIRTITLRHFIWYPYWVCFWEICAPPFWCVGYFKLIITPVENKIRPQEEDQI